MDSWKNSIRNMSYLALNEMSFKDGKVFAWRYGLY